MSVDSERWDRLADALTVTCPPQVFAVTTRSYPGGVSRSVIHRLPDGDSVEVRDTWWVKNHDVWTGYRIDLVDQEGIIRRTWPITKKRSEAAAAVLAAIAFAESSAVGRKG